MNRGGSFGEISDLNGHLYLSAAHVIKPESIKRKNINFIVNATVEEPNMYLKNGDYLKIRINDHPSARLDAYFDVVADKIKANKDSGGKSLVHCVAGVSRSASLCIAYLMKYEKMTLKQAYNHIKAIRPIIRPNHGFWKQLIEYEQRLFGTNTVQMVESKWGPEEPVPDVYRDELKEPQISRPSAYHAFGRNFNQRSLSNFTMTPPASRKYQRSSLSSSPLMNHSLTSYSSGVDPTQFRSKFKSDMLSSVYYDTLAIPHSASGYNSYGDTRKSLFSNGANNNIYSANRSPLRSL